MDSGAAVWRWGGHEVHGLVASESLLSGEEERSVYVFNLQMVDVRLIFLVL